MELQVLFLVIMVFVSSLLTIFGNRIHIAYPVLLVLAGLVISFLPFIPIIKIDPEVIFYIFLPPLLYMSAVSLSLKETLNWKRVILCFAFLVVFLTASCIGLLATWLVPGMTLAMGMMLGGILASTDAVSATTIMHQVKVPSRISTILEGESMLNDASSLITFSFALIAVQTGSFVIEKALLSFIWVVFGGGITGVLIGMMFIYLHKILPDKDPNVTIIFTLIAPYLMYIVAESVGASGVLGVVCGGFYMSQHRDVIDANSRLLGRSVWDNLIFILNGLAFLIIGLNLPQIMAGVESDGFSLFTATIFSVIVLAIIIAIRMLCAYLAIPISRIRRKSEHLGYNLIVDKPTAIIVGWCGMRGVLSLAAALSIPYLLNGGEPFPNRSLMLYCSFIVIFGTLVLQGLSLPLFLKRVHFPEYQDHLSDNETFSFIRKGLAECGLKYLEEHPVQNKDDEQVFDYFKVRWQKRLMIDSKDSMLKSMTNIYRNILVDQRNYLFKLNKERPDINEEIIHHFIRSIDMEEERLRRE